MVSGRRCLPCTLCAALGTRPRFLLDAPARLLSHKPCIKHANRVTVDLRPNESLHIMLPAADSYKTCQAVSSEERLLVCE